MTVNIFNIIIAHPPAGRFAFGRVAGGVQGADERAGATEDASGPPLGMRRLGLVPRLHIIIIPSASERGQKAYNQK
jgi:hypothetical protein